MISLVILISLISSNLNKNISIKTYSHFSLFWFLKTNGGTLVKLLNCKCLRIFYLKFYFYKNVFIVIYCQKITYIIFNELYPSNESLYRTMLLFINALQN